MSSVAWQNERLKLIGEPTIAIAGYTFPALMFKLPNSGVVVDLAFSVDRTGKNKNKYMDNVKKYVDSVGDVGTYLDQIMNEDTYSKDYLMGKDKLIQYVLKH